MLHYGDISMLCGHCAYKSGIRSSKEILQEYYNAQHILDMKQENKTTVRASGSNPSFSQVPHVIDHILMNGIFQLRFNLDIQTFFTTPANVELDTCKTQLVLLLLELFVLNFTL